jgi:hypothetical protein
MFPPALEEFMRPRKTLKLSESIHHQLNAYALAATTAGVGMLALIPTTEFLLPSGVALAGVFALPELADAKIIYTQTSKLKKVLLWQINPKA